MPTNNHGRSGQEKAREKTTNEPTKRAEWKEAVTTTRLHLERFISFFLTPRVTAVTPNPSPASVELHIFSRNCRDLDVREGREVMCNFRRQKGFGARGVSLFFVVVLFAHVLRVLRLGLAFSELRLDFPLSFGLSTVRAFRSSEIRSHSIPSFVFFFRLPWRWCFLESQESNLAGVLSVFRPRGVCVCVPRHVSMRFCSE